MSIVRKEKFTVISKRVKLMSVELGKFGQTGRRAENLLGSLPWYGKGPVGKVMVAVGISNQRGEKGSECGATTEGKCRNGRSNRVADNQGVLLQRLGGRESAEKKRFSFQEEKNSPATKGVVGPNFRATAVPKGGCHAS